jgi:hypothetical protein
MLMRTLLSLPLLALTMAPGSGLAQNQDTPKTLESQTVYKLEFVLKEVEGGKVLNARTYSAMVSVDAKNPASTSIRAGGVVSYNDAKGPQSVSTGVNIDCRAVKEVERGLSLNVSADISSVPSEPVSPGAAPMIRQNRWSSPAIVPLKKPTLLFSSDDPMSKRQMQLELTVTSIM